MLMIASGVNAAEPGATPVPAAIAALKGCWHGSGTVMGKQVSISLAARPIVQGGFFLIEAESGAVADPKDRYSAHLIFGGADKRPGTAAEQIFGFWADSFGSGFTADGTGESRPDGFDVTYQYPDDAFVNRWRLVKDRLTWEIVARDGKGTEKPFAAYALTRAVCPRASGS